MKKFLGKTALYLFLILLMLELAVRAFHLYTVDPPRYIDDHGVEKRVPHHNGYSVTGNRKQNFSEFNINKSGFNSHREFNPSASKYEIAIVGDSYIEGFHQDYQNSIGQKIEEKIEDIEVYQYGYAGYDFANQMHLVYAYQDTFDLIDEIILYLNYENDLERDRYTPNTDRIKMLSSTLFKIRDQIKLLSYGSKIGVLEPFKKLATGQNPFKTDVTAYQSNEIKEETKAEKLERDKRYIANFQNLIKLYGFNKSKTTLLLDTRKTSNVFLDFCDQNNIKYIDFSESFKKSKKSTNLIYDMHWNDHGRELIAEVIASYIRNKKKD
ncbi:MAG: hypothetical protein R3243_12035 [Arenibacter latericius]|nr:hypothetical protein [Arenibacter latericius]